MQYEAKNPKEYLSQLDDDWRRTALHKLREIILDVANGLVEDINYKMLGFRDSDGFVFHLNAQKNYVSLYVGDIEKIDSGRTLLEGLNLGKGCIRFSKTAPIDRSRLSEFIQRALTLREQGVAFSC